MTIFHSKKLLTQVENGLSPMVTPPPLSPPSRNDNQFPHLMSFSCTPLALSDFSAYIMFPNRGQISEFSLKSSKKEDHSSGCDLRVCTSLLRFRLLRTTHPTRVKSYKTLDPQGKNWHQDAETQVVALKGKSLSTNAMANCVAAIELRGRQFSLQQGAVHRPLKFGVSV